MRRNPQLATVFTIVAVLCCALAEEPGDDPDYYVRTASSLLEHGDAREALRTMLVAARLSSQYSDVPDAKAWENLRMLKADIVRRAEEARNAPASTSPSTTRWLSLSLKVEPMTEPAEMRWNDGDCPFIISRMFCERYNLDMKQVHRPLYTAIREMERDKLGKPLNDYPPPWDIPPEYLDDFTMNGDVAVEYHYRDDSLDGGERRPYRRSEINDFIAAAARKETNYYGPTDQFLYKTLEHFDGVKGKTVLIVGSLIPWYEAICLTYGATKCVTTEYHVLDYDHPRLETMLPDAVNGYIARNGQFTAAFVISSFEHDGLGRYGDPVNPDGDILAMNNLAKQVVKGGLVYVAVPCGPDKLVWNAHRQYGRKRLAKLFANWTLLGSAGVTPGLFDNQPEFHYQPVFVLKNSQPKKPNVF